MSNLMQTDLMSRTGRRVMDLYSPPRVSRGKQINLPFDIRANAATGYIEFYATSDLTTTTDMAYLNGEELEWADEPSPVGIIETGWVELALLPTDPGTTTVYFRLEPYTSLAVDADLTSATAMRWVISTSAAATPHGTFKQRVIATVNNTGGVYTVTQFLRGSQSVNTRYTDTESEAKLAGNDLHKTQSIDTQSADGNGNQSLTLFGFKAGATITPPASLAGIIFLIRKVVAGITKLQYLDGADLQAAIEGIITDYTPSIIHNNLDGLQGGDGTNYYHLSGDYFAIDPDTGLPVFDLRHSDLVDVMDQTVGDDHRGARNEATGIGTPPAHPYIHANGDGQRNSMGIDAWIGDDSGTLSGGQSISPAKRVLAVETGVYSVNWNDRHLLLQEGRETVDWSLGLLRALISETLTTTLNWFTRVLSGGFWTVTDGTAATGTGASTAGALIVDGGVNIKRNAIIQDTTAADVGTGALVVAGGISAGVGAYISNETGTRVADLGGTQWAGRFLDIQGNIVVMADGSRAINVESGNYHHLGVAGISGDGFSGGIKTSAAAAETAVISATMFGGLL